jgi:hypothetical protein
MRNRLALCALAGILVCMAPLRAAAADSSYTYPVSTDYDLTLTLKNADNIAVNNSVRYFRGGSPSLNARIDSRLAGASSSRYYLTNIEVYNETTKRVAATKSEKGSFTWNYTGSLYNITVTVFIERIEGNAAPSSNQFSIQYREDTKAPVVAISHGGVLVDSKVASNRSPFELTGSAVDEGAGVNEATWTHARGSAAAAAGNLLSFQGGEGSESVTFQVNDRLGNAGKKTITAIVDRTPPTLDILSRYGLSSGDWTGERGFSLTPTAKDALAGLNDTTWQYSADGGATWSAEGKAVVLTVATEGVNDIRFRVKDLAGNVGSASFLCNVDKTPPVAAISTSPADGWSAGSGITVTATAGDALSGLNAASWQYSTNGGSSWSAEGTAAAVTITAEGKYDVRFRVADLAGNRSVVSVLCGIDRAPPTVALTAKPSNGWSAGSGISVTATAGDALSGLNAASWQYSTDGGASWSAEGAANAITIGAEGRYHVQFRVRDLAGNTGSASLLCGVDKTPPLLELRGTMGDAWIVQSPYSLGVTATDAISGVASLEYSLNNGSWHKASSFDASVAVTGEGKQTVSFRAKDAAGNTGSAAAAVNIDTQPPQYRLDLNGCAYREGSGWVVPLYVWGLSDASSGVDYASVLYALDGGAWTPAPGSFSGNGFYCSVNAASLSAGAHTAKLSIADKAGNRTEMSLAFSVDITPPVITVLSPVGDTANGAPWTNQNRLAYAVRDTESGVKTRDLAVSVVLPNGYLSPLSGYGDTGTELVLEDDGTYRVSIKATDRANNAAVETSFYYRLDRTPPDITTDLIKSASRSVTIRGSDALSGLNPGSCWTSETAGVSGAAGYLVTLPDGIYEREFTLKDNAGNSATKKVAIYIDQNPPGVAVAAPDYWGAEKLPVTIVLTSAVMALSDVWCLLDGVRTDLSKAQWNSVSLPLDSCAEGIHTLTVGAMNEIGLSGESAPHQFIIDRTPPELTGYELREAAHPERVIAEGEYVPGGGVLAAIAAEDRYVDGATTGRGVVQSYAWAVTRRVSDAPVYYPANRSAANEFAVQNFADGINYLWVRAEDGAGNLSLPLRIAVLQDQGSPGAPVIKSSTHAEAVRAEQAGFLSRAEFSFLPAFGLKSGVRAYQWKAEKLYVLNNAAGNAVAVREGETDNLDPEGRGGLSLELADNDENEFYQLLARCVGGNGAAGPWASYRFRIDSKAPEGLIVQAVPQTDSASWYNQQETLALWNKPSDMTGVAEYRHILLDEEETRAFPLEERDTSSWDATGDTRLRANLRALLGAKESGRLRIGVSAVDYAGNEQLGQLSFGYDFVPPRFNQSALSISDAENALGAGKLIRWGGARDDESGPDRIVILVSSGDRTRSFAVEPGQEEYVVSPLEEDRAFAVTVRAYDRAGNRAELYDVCVTGNAALPSAYYVPYGETIRGYDLSGKKRLEGGAVAFEDLALQIPGALELFALAAGDDGAAKTPLGEIPLEALTVRDGVFQSGRSREGAGAYELRSGGFVLEGSALRFSRDGGLELENASYVRPLIVSGALQDRRIKLGEVNAGTAPLTRFSSGVAALGVEARIESVYRESGGGAASSGFALTGVDSLFLSEGREWLGGAGLSFDRKPLADMAIRLEDPRGEVLLRDAALEAGSENLAALLDLSAQNPLTLVMGDAVYRVSNAGIRGNLLDIYEAVLPLPEGCEPAALTVRNITIDTRTGLVRQGPDFFVENLVVTGPGGAVFEGVTARIDSQGRLLVTGDIGSPAYGLYRTEELPLSNTGIDWELGAEIREFFAETHGFPIAARRARVTASGIYIAEGTIDVWGNRQTLVGLGLRIDRKDSVWREGIIAGTFSGDPGYGAPVQLSDGRVADGGVFAVAAVPLGDWAADPGGAKQWILPEARVYPHYALAGAFDGAKTLAVANLTVRAEQCSFDEQGLRIGTAWVEQVPNLSPATLAFTGLGLSYQGVSVEGVSENEVRFAASGWEIRYASLGFDGQGIKGRGSLALPALLGGLALAFPETRITAEGLLVSGSPDETREILRFQGLPVFADGVSLRLREGALVLELVSPRISLGPIDGPDIFFGKTVFDSAGRVLQGDPETKKFDFASFNGYRIGVEASKIDDQGFSLSGTLAARLFGRDLVVSGGTFRVLPDLSVSGTGPDTDLVYRFGDWSLRGRDIAFDVDRIRIGSNRVLFREVEFDLGEIPLGIDGRLLQQVVRRQETGVSLFGGGAAIAETRLSEGGIEASVRLTLPAVLGGASFVFDKVGFRADGEFWIEETVDAFSFAAHGFSFALEDLTLDSRGLRAAKTTITLPESLESVGFTVQDLRISAAGEVGIGNASVSPFVLWNMNFSLNSFSIVDGEARFQGGVRLPAAMPGELSNRHIQIRDFRASLEGGITALDICLEGDYAVPLGKAWSLLFRNVRISHADGQPWISAERTELLLPKDYGVKDGYIDQAKFNPLTGEFVFSELALSSDLSLEFGGVTFALATLKIDSRFSLAFGGSVRFPASGLPGFLAGKTAAFNRLEILSDGTLGELDVKLEGLEGGVVPGFEGLVLKKGSVSLLKQGTKSLSLSVGGSIALGASMPAGLAGAALKIDAFTYDMEARKILRLKATAVLPTANSLGSLFSKLSIGIDWNEAKQTGLLNLAGNVVLPSSFPAFLAGREAKISSFKIGLDGTVQSFAAKYTTEKNKPYDAFGLLQLSDVSIEAALKSGVVKFDLAGIVILPESRFPQGIGGTSAAIAMEFDTASGLKSASARANLPNAKLFGSLEVRNGTIGIAKPAGKALEISVGGSLVLPALFPEGLRGLVVGIRSLTMNASGEILEVDIGASGMNAKLFGSLELSNGSIAFKKGAGDEFLVSVGGSARLNSLKLPAGLRNATLELRALELSTRDGLRSLDAGVKGELAFSILGGLAITVSSLSLSEAGMSMAASAKLPATYPNGLANAQFALTSLKLGWNGSLLEITGGMKKWSMTLAGFNATIDELYFEKDSAGQFCVALKSCKLQIPKNLGTLGGSYVAIKNAKFSPVNGSFQGDIEVPKIETEIAGFKLVMDTPSLSFSENLVNFSKVTLKLPSFFGKGEVALKKVTLSAGAGLTVSGGSFKLPSFNAGLFAFNDVKVAFSLSGSEYSLEGSGSVIIPGAGNISATVGFATKSATYPIGLKRAEFSYVLHAGGIPLGSSGLFLNGIAGGLSYGPPTEVPSIGRGLFNNSGPRMKVGLSLADSSGGSLISMMPTVWVDLNNGSWAFNGAATVLKGTLNFTAEVNAAMGNQGFVGQFAVDISFARGDVTVYVFKKNGGPIMSGKGKVEFGIPEGALIDTWFWTFPSSTLWLARVNAEFGRFTNGATGVKGTVSAPVFGTVGAFVGTGGIKLGSLSEYKIEEPSWSRSLRFFDSDGVASYDRADSSGKADAGYQFFVPPKGERGGAPLSLLHEAYDGTEAVPGSGLERLIVVLEYPQGAPELTVVSPRGIVYREGYEGCETIVEKNGVLMAIPSAEAGIWELRVSGLEEESYRASVLGSMALPPLVLEEPALPPDSPAEQTQGAARVRGWTEKGQSSVRIFAQESEELPGFDLGSYAVDPEGRFDLAVPLGDLRDGEYLVYAELDGPDVEFSPLAYAPGKILLDRSEVPLLAPRLRVAETDPGVLSLRWQNPNGGRVAGYKARIADQGEGTESLAYVGDIEALDLPGYTAEQELSFSVAALDHAGLTGPWSAAAAIRPGQEKPRVNRPTAVAGRFEATGVSGGFLEGVVRAAIADFEARDDSAGYVGVRYAGPPPEQALALHFGPAVQATEQGVELPWSLGVEESLPPGLYEYPCEFFNEANGALNSPFVLAVEIRWPAPEVAWAEPNKLRGIDETLLSLHGSGFVPGTRVFWGDEELAILDGDSGSMRALVPPRFSAADARLNDTEQAELLIRGPGGDQTVFPLTVLLPSYRLSLYARVAETLPGGSADYAIAAESLNGFAGTLSFRAVAKPEDLDLVLPELTVRPGAGPVTGTITIQAGNDALPGSRSVVVEGNGGKLFELALTTLAEQPPPVLSSVIPRAAFIGDTVHLYGNNLGQEGTLLVKGRETPVSSWSEGEIRFVVPDDALSGDVSLLVAGTTSNALPFTVRDRGFELRPSADLAELAAGEEKALPLTVTGHEATVALSLVCEPGAPFTAALSRTAVKPGEPLELRLRADALAGNGSWLVVLRGESRGFEASAEIKVVIGNSLRIATARLPEGLVDVAYHAELTSHNARGALAYRVAGGALPPGLSLSVQGLISGRPAEKGRYSLDIEARDSLGWKDKRSFVITVWEESWGQAGKDGGNSRSVKTDLSATGEVAWIYPGEEPVAQLLGAENRIIARGRDHLFALNAGNGSLAWREPGSYTAILYAGGKLYALAEGGRLEARDPQNGSLLWTRDSIEAISSDGATLLEETATGRFFRHAERGTLIEEQRKGEGAVLPLLWQYGSAYALRGSALVPLYGPGAAWDAGERILAAAADVRGGAALTENSLVLFDRTMTETGRTAAAHGPGALLSLTAEGVSVLDQGQLRSYDREDLRFQWARGTDGRAALANGLEKTVVAGEEGLAVLNRYDGRVIWRDEKPSPALALYHGKIVAADAGGAITAFDGPPNVAGPFTELRLDPPDPGESLWHTRRPTLAITSVDRETYVARILMRHNNGPWIDAPESFAPEDGEHHLVVYGVDSRGVAGAEARLQFRVDTGLPESDLAIYPEESESGWYNEPVTIALEAWDAVSGIDWIWTSESAYTGPALFWEQGERRFAWQALDRAGNREPLRELTIRIDREPPLAEASVEQDRGLAELSIHAVDSLSGLAFIEYRINDGAVERYGEPLLFADPGSYLIRYRAVDRAGNSGEWQNCDVRTPQGSDDAVVIDAPLLNGVPRAVATRARNGMLLVGGDGGEDFSPGAPEAMTNLPPYALGAEYIRWDRGDELLDEAAGIRFRVKRNAALYLFLPRSVPAPRGWSLVEDGAGINRLLYPRGAAAYMRRYGAGALVELPGTPAGAALPLIMAQETGSLSADIGIRREGEALVLEALAYPRLHSRRLPLRRRWFVNAGDGWEALEGNRYEAGAPAAEPLEASGETPRDVSAGEESVDAPLRFRLELYTPDGEVECRVEKVREEEED